ncbi:3-dehydroquinate synthase [Corynebacterium lactis]|uniref:3-dehydroquinate synthase n=1 Tax=Corynebacterium lactis RW2-5 TaxID=1408189 RepID=A0A0K2GZY0_9CORY|nr:3-dehydroquinate synthase [Corynebacterium lactis]ALA67347.1 3-dehydroquinate synthase [Corynebacterium lactis RW2-5]
MDLTRTIPVEGPAPYSVTMGYGLTDRIAESVSFASQVAVIHQGSVQELALGVINELANRGIDAFAIQIPDAEEGKTLTVAETVWDTFGERGMGRKDAVVSIGGGAATDFGGFVAAAWMRGIAVVQVPTTLLAMVDAAVGGKTGINTAAGKNLVGAFHEPTAVFLDLDVLRTLPSDEMIAGSAEIIKAGFIADPKILDLYESDPSACLDVDGALPELIERAVAVKARVVSEDLKEAGLREILNYGHTFGHAVEHFENYRWRHGHAVAVGMVFVAELAKLTGHIDQDLVDRHRAILESIGLPTTYDAGHFEELYSAMTRDKKNRKGTIRFVVLDDVAKTSRLEGPSRQDLERAYELVYNSGRPATEESARS